MIKHLNNNVIKISDIMDDIFVDIMGKSMNGNTNSNINIFLPTLYLKLFNVLFRSYNIYIVFINYFYNT